MRTVALVIAFASIASSAGVAGVSEDLVFCSKIANERERVACYDAIARKHSTRPASAAAAFNRAKTISAAALEPDVPNHALDKSTEWTGVYVGGLAGFGFSTVDWRYTSGSAVPGFNTRGALVGGTVGANLAVGTWLFGTETDYSWAWIRGERQCPNRAFGCRSNLTNLGTVRFRFGYTGLDSWLFYGTGGFAYGHQYVSVTTSGGIPSGWYEAGSTTLLTGWTAGAGVERKFAERWSLKAEALYINLAASKPQQVDVLVDAPNSGVVVRAGLNYHLP